MSVRLFTPDGVAAPHRTNQTTVASIIERYLDQLRLRHDLGQYTPAALDRARFYLASFAIQHGDKAMPTCASADLTAWLLAHPEWKSDHTRNDALGAVVTAFRWAEEERLIERTPYRRPRGLQLKLKPRRPISRTEVVAVHRAASPRAGRRKCPGGLAFRKAVLFLRRTGARTCEMRAAKWDHVDWDAGVIRLDEHKTATTSGEARVIGLDPAMMRLLAIWFNRRGDSPFIFLNSRGRAWTKSSFTRQFRAFARIAGLAPGLSAYCLRHGFATDAIEAGVGERQIADAMGHKSTRYVSWYAAQCRQRATHLRNVTSQILKGKRGNRTDGK